MLIAVLIAVFLIILYNCWCQFIFRKSPERLSEQIIKKYRLSNPNSEVTVESFVILDEKLTAQLIVDNRRIVFILDIIEECPDIVNSCIVI